MGLPRKLRIELQYDPAITVWDIYPENTIIKRITISHIHQEKKGRKLKSIELEMKKEK